MYVKKISKDELKDLPLLRYEGEVRLVENETDLREAILHCSKSHTIGFDTETKPTFKKGQYNPVALVQLATKEVVYLIRLNKTGLTKELLDFFENHNIKKIGIGLRDDIKDLQKISPFEPCGFVDLNELAEELELESIGARNFSGMFLKKRISKSQQVSNWENPQLTSGQITYAATDAWICLEIYERMLQALNEYSN